MTGNKKWPAGAVPIIMMIFMTACSLAIAACGGNGPEGKQEVMQEPGTLRDGLYLSGDGRFTVETAGDQWSPGQVKGVSELYFIEDRNVWISFSPTAGITKDMIGEFGTSFADSYAEALRDRYPDVRIDEIRQVNEAMAGLLMTMSDSLGGYKMYQMLYLASDGEDGYLITSVLPAEKEAVLKPVIIRVIESFRFMT